MRNYAEIFTADTTADSDFDIYKPKVLESGHRKKEKSKVINLKSTYNFVLPPELEIVVVGAGGTGGFVIRDLARFLASYKGGRLEKINLTIIDHDTVETKNLTRQNFIEQDLGRYKAEVLAERYSSAFGLEISSITEKADISILNKIVNESKRHRGTPILLIGCVDNNEARRHMFECVRKNSDHWGSSDVIAWIDAGNEKSSGQVIVGSAGNYCTSYLPFVTDLYPEILDKAQDPKDKISCADRAQQDIQNIFVNLTAANHVLNFMNTIMNEKKTMTHGVEFSITGAATPLFIEKKIKPGDAFQKGNSIWNKTVKG